MQSTSSDDSWRTSATIPASDDYLDDSHIMKPPPNNRAKHYLYHCPNWVSEKSYLKRMPLLMREK
jgi:hypothetical protein